MRFLGVLNAAVWLGAAVFRFTVITPATQSRVMQELFGPALSPYFTGAAELILIERCFYLQLTCAVVALALAQVERLYLGRELSSLWVGVLAVMIGLGSAGGFWFTPKAVESHRAQNARGASQPMRESAASSARVWRGVNAGTNLLLLAGSLATLWRSCRPQTTTRFLDPGKLRG